MYEITEYEKQTKNGTERGYRVHLKEYVQEAFGVAIEDAYIEFRAYSWKDKDREGMPQARREAQRFIEEAKKEGLSLDARNLMVKFAGGNLVCIWNSEWGGIRNEEQ